MTAPIIVDTGGLLRALARTSDGGPSFPDYETVLTSASLVIVPGLVLAEVDYFLREDRAAMRKLVAEVFDVRTRYEYNSPWRPTLFERLSSTRSSRTSAWGWSTAR